MPRRCASRRGSWRAAAPRGDPLARRFDTKACRADAAPAPPHLRALQPDAEVEFQTGPLSVLTQSVKANTQASACLCCPGTPQRAQEAASHAAWTRHTREQPLLRLARRSLGGRGARGGPCERERGQP